jgi:NAD(P)-dependent dehydrogenase (short-subunit alcohol dehydrogenase family)
MGLTIVITGVSRGLGLAMIEQFIEQGHTVLGCARSNDAVKELSNRFGLPHQFTAIDISDPKAVSAWAENLLFGNKAPDLLINNAALMNTPAPLWNIPVDEFIYLINVNVIGVFNVIRAFVPSMFLAQQGIIVNFSSGWGRYASPGVAPYCASKWAIEGLTQALSKELPSTMGVIALSPGIIHTDMLETCSGDAAFAYPSAKSWALRAVPFLLSFQPKDNGQSLTVPE